MKRSSQILLFHLFQIVFIYVPGALIIPAGIVISLFNIGYAILLCLILILVVGIAFYLRPRIALRLGLDQNYE